MSTVTKTTYVSLNVKLKVTFFVDISLCYVTFRTYIIIIGYVVQGHNGDVTTF